MKKYYPYWLLLFVTIFLASTYFRHPELGFVGDLYDVNFLHVNFAFNMLWAKKILFWNPFAFNGDVWLGQPLVGMFYPINWLVTLLFRGYSLNAFFLSCWITVFFYFLGHYYLFRALGLPRLSSFISSVLCQSIYIGYMHGGDRHIAGMATVWLLGSFLAFIRTLKLRHLTLLTFSFFCFISAYPAFYSHILLLGGVFLPLYLFMYLRPSGQNYKNLFRWSALGLFLCIGFSAVQLIPVFEKLLSMGRAIPVRFIINDAGGYTGVSWKDLKWVFFKPDYPMYWGSFVLACLLVSIVHIRRRLFYRTILTSTITLAVLASFIRKGVVFEFLYHYLPLFQKIRQIYQIQIYLGLCLSIIGAFLLHNFVCTLRRKDKGYIVLLFAFLGAALQAELNLHHIGRSVFYLAAFFFVFLAVLWKSHNRLARSALLASLVVFSVVQTQNNLYALIPRGPHNIQLSTFVKELKSGIHPAPNLPLKDQNYRKVSDFCVWHQWYVNDASVALHGPSEMKQNIISIDHRSLDLPDPQMTTLVFLPSQSNRHFRFYFDVKNGKNISLMEQVFSFYPRATVVTDSISTLNKLNSDPFTTLFLDEMPADPLATKWVLHDRPPTLPDFKELEVQETVSSSHPQSYVSSYRVLEDPFRIDLSGKEGLVFRVSVKVHKNEKIDYASNLNLTFKYRGADVTALIFHPEQDGEWHDYIFNLGRRRFDQIAVRFTGYSIDEFKLRNLSYTRVENYDQEVKQVQIDPTQFSAKVYSSQGGFLLLSDLFHPSWRAEVDHQGTPVLKAFGRFKAVFVPPGEHEILFHFTPYFYLVGLGFTALTLLGFALLFFRRASPEVENFLERFRLQWK